MTIDVRSPQHPSWIRVRILRHAGLDPYADNEGIAQAAAPMLYFDYDRQTWIRDGIVQRCGHPSTMRCGCYGREHAGERINDRVSAEGRPSVNHTHARAGLRG